MRKSRRSRVAAIPIKKEWEIQCMRRACAVTVQILDEVGLIVKPGVSTEEINTFVDRRMNDLGAIPATLNYKGYTKSVCTSPNDVVCHGVPSPYVILAAGDILNIDVTSIVEGYHGDSSRMYLVGGAEVCSAEALELVDVARHALYAGIKQVKSGHHIGDIGAGIQEYIKGVGSYGIVTEYTGHGLGRQFHEPPQVCHIGQFGKGPEMRPGMTFTIEPMINIGGAKTTLSKLDGWTVRTADGSLSAQWEHTILVTEGGCEVLTLAEGEVVG